MGGLNGFFDDGGASSAAESDVRRRRKRTAAVCGAVAGGIAVAVAAAAVCICFRGCSRSGAASAARDNTLSLVRRYMEKGEYERALDKLDELLILNGADEAALALMDEAIAAKASGGGADGSAKGAGSPPAVTVSVDTDGITEAVRSMESELAKNSAAAEENRRAVADLLRRQQEQNALEESRTEERLRRQAAEEARQKQEAAERQAAEEALAKKSAQLRREVALVNDEVRQGQAALNSGSISSALAHFEKAAAALPVSDGEPAFSAGKHSEMASLLHDAAQNAADAGSRARLGEAAVLYAEKAVEDDPNNAPAHYILGKYAVDGRDYQSALAHFTAAVAGDSSDPKNSLYYYDLGRVQYTLKKYTEAKHSFTTAAQLGSGFAQAHYNLALTDLRLGDQKAALAEFRRAHDIDPRYEKAHLEEARLLTKLGDSSGAIAAYQNVVRLNSMNRAALQELGSVYSQAGRLSEAEQTFRQSLALVPAGTDDPLTCYNLSAVLFEEGRPEESAEYAKKAYDAASQLKDAASKINVTYNYALLCEATGDVDTAVEKYGEVLAQNALHLKTLINLGAIYMNMTPPDTEGALSLLLAAYNQDSGNFEVNNNLGSAYLEKKDFKSAALHFQNALKINAKSNEMRMNLAKAFAGDGQYDNARTVYSELLKQDPSNWDAYVELGKVCMALKDDAGAEKYLVYVQAKNPSHRAAEVEALLSSISAGAVGAE